jgi:hypothetical protein
VAGKDYNRNARFQLRIDPRTLESIRRKAEARGLPLNQYIADVLERDADDTTAYHLQMASRHSYMTYAMLNIIASKLLPADVRKDVTRAVGEQGNKLFGANPAIPDAIIARTNSDDDAFVADLFAVFQRYSESRWKIKPE